MVPGEAAVAGKLVQVAMVSILLIKSLIGVLSANTCEVCSGTKHKLIDSSNNKLT